MSNNKSLIAQLILISTLIAWPLSGLTQEYTDKVHAVITSEKIATISSPMNGYIEKLNIKDGSHFKTNQTLIEFDCRLQLAEQKKATAEVTLSKINLNSQKRLNQLGSASKIKLAEADAQYLKSLAELEIADKQVSDCNIQAPFDGQITELYVHQHETIKINQQIFNILSNDSIIVRLLVPSYWLSKINIGTDFTINIKETNKTYTAKIVRISNSVDAVSRSVKVIAEVTDKQSDLKSGMSGYAFFKDINS